MLETVGVPAAKTLNATQLQAASMDAFGWPAGKIGKELGVAPTTITLWRKLPEYQEKKKSFLAEFEKKMLERAGIDFEEIMNSFVPEAIYTYVELMRGADSDSVRLHAADKLLDRAPNAPKTIKGDGLGNVGGLVVQLGTKGLEAMQKALGDIEDDEAIELMKGLDWEEIEEGEGEGEFDKNGVVKVVEV